MIKSPTLLFSRKALLSKFGVRVLAFILLVCFTAQVATADDIGDIISAGSWWIAYEYYGGNNIYRFSFTISAKEIAGTPIWPGGNDEPPLPQRKALKAARECFSKFLKGSENWPLDKLSLEQVGDDGHWIYLVTFTHPLPPGVKKGQTSLSEIGIPVLMNGVAIEPKIKRVEKGQ